MGSSVRTCYWGLFLGVFACGGGSPDRAARHEIVSDFEDPSGAVAYAGTWRFEDGGTLSGLRLAPAMVAGEGPVAISFVAHGLCGGRIGLLAPRAAAFQDVYRGEPLAPVKDARETWAAVRAEDGGQQLALALARPFHAGHAIVVFEQDCDGALIPVTEGARAQALRDGAPVPGGRAILGMVEVAREPTKAMAVRGEVSVDGQLSEAVWSGAGHPLVKSLDGEPGAAAYATRVWFAWDDRALFVAAEIEDPDLWSEFADQDDPLYRQEAFELFIAGEDPTDGYLEFQVSARDVTFDAHFPSYRKGDEAWDSAWTTAVHLRGTINERGDRDEGWTVEAAIPWTEICERTGATCPIRPGQQLRVNAFRLEKPDRKRQEGYALSPTVVPDFHAWQNAAILGFEG